MQDAADFYVRLAKHFARFFLGEPADGHEPFRLQNRHDPGQVRVADFLKRLGLVGRQLVRRAVSAGVLEEGQRAVVHDEMPGEEGLRLAKFLGENPPKPAATHLAARAVKAQHGALGMLFGRLADGRVDA